MNKYLLVLSNGAMYTTQAERWYEALSKFYKHLPTPTFMEWEDFDILVKNKTSDKAITLFNNTNAHTIEFFGVIHQPFVCDAIDIDEDEKPDCKYGCYDCIWRLTDACNQCIDANMYDDEAK